MNIPLICIDSKFEICLLNTGGRNLKYGKFNREKFDRLLNLSLRFLSGYDAKMSVSYKIQADSRCI